MSPKSVLRSLLVFVSIVCTMIKVDECKEFKPIICYFLPSKCCLGSNRTLRINCLFYGFGKVLLISRIMSATFAHFGDAPFLEDHEEKVFCLLLRTQRVSLIMF